MAIQWANPYSHSTVCRVKPSIDQSMQSILPIQRMPSKHNGSETDAAEQSLNEIRYISQFQSIEPAWGAMAAIPKSVDNPGWDELFYFQYNIPFFNFNAPSVLTD